VEAAAVAATPEVGRDGLLTVAAEKKQTEWR